MDVLPASTPAYFRTDAASEDMSVLLEDRFIRRVAEEAGADPDEIEFVPFFSAPTRTTRAVAVAPSEMTASRGGCAGIPKGDLARPEEPYGAGKREERRRPPYEDARRVAKQTHEDAQD